MPYAGLVLAAAFANFDTRPRGRRRGCSGAGPLRRLVLVTLPALRPAAGRRRLFLRFLISWSEYILTLLVGGGTVRTLPLLLFAAIGTADLPAAAALALVIALPPLAAGRPDVAVAHRAHPRRHRVRAAVT